jgi:bifunctional non-homologous end joining protein LigD
VFVDEGAVVRDAAAQLGLEGVVAKRLTSVYEPGRRSPAWRKVKLVQHDEFVVGGFTVGDGRRAGTLGALLLGGRDPAEEGALRFVGSVGTGLSDVDLQRLRRRLDGAVTGVDPFAVGPPRPRAMFVEPRIVVEVRYGGWTRDRVLRHPSYLGERSDRPPSDVYLPASPDERT